MCSDSGDLERFVAAQDERAIYEQALAELRSGRKTSHWMWFVFPQISGLGKSEMSKRYALNSLDEARAYARHPVLGPRLLACVKAILDCGATAPEIFGAIDAVKLHSSLTLFAHAAPHETIFIDALERYFAGAMDSATIERLAELEGAA